MRLRGELRVTQLVKTWNGSSCLQCSSYCSLHSSQQGPHRAQHTAGLSVVLPDCTVPPAPGSFGPRFSRASSYSLSSCAKMETSSKGTPSARTQTEATQQPWKLTLQVASRTYQMYPSGQDLGRRKRLLGCSHGGKQHFSQEQLNQPPLHNCVHLLKLFLFSPYILHPPSTKSYQFFIQNVSWIVRFSPLSLPIVFLAWITITSNRSPWSSMIYYPCSNHWPIMTFPIHL